MTSSTDSVTMAFSAYISHLESEHDTREEIRTALRDLEQTSRELTAVIQKIHTPGAVKKLPTIVDELDSLFSSKIRPQLKAFAATLPSNEYFRFHGMFWGVLQRLVFTAAMRHYLATETLLGREEAAAALGIETDPKLGFHLELEDYLGGLINTSNELSRFAVNCVTAGDYGRPLRIAGFVGDILTGFRLLNLKNDGLRKKFDSLKYDLKKVEEVVYDISIRGLIKQEEDASEGTSEEKEVLEQGDGNKKAEK